MQEGEGTIDVELAGWKVSGKSVGGIETCLEVPDAKLAFDIGRCPLSAVRLPFVLFTHAHIDHMGGVAFHSATRALWGMRPPTYLVPHENARDFEQLLETWRRLDGSQLKHELVPIGPGESWALGSELLARPFRSPHRAPCQGYGIWSVREKLAPQYRGLPPEELRRLRVARGVTVTRRLEFPELAFTGDSRIEVLEREAVVREARRLIMEVTFVDDRVSVEQCRASGHIHLFEVAERAELFRNEAILFTHFSSRYSAKEILAALDRHLPPGLRERVQPLLTGWET